MNISSQTEEKVKKKEKTPSYIADIRMRTNKKQTRNLLVKGEMGRLLYNACLGESLKRLQKIKKTDLYKETIALDKVKDKEKRKDNFKQLNETFGFTDASIQSFGTKTKNDSKMIAYHLGTHVCQKIATRAFRAVQKVAFHKAKRVQFKRKGEFVSLEGKSNKTFLTYSNGYVMVGKDTIPCVFPKGDKDKWLNHALQQRVKFCRIVKRIIKGKDVFYLQLTLEGYPYQKYKMGDETAGFDIGPSTIATVTDSFAELRSFCEGIPNLDKEKCKLQRKSDRQRRANNPQYYNENGTIKKGRKRWHISNQMKKTLAELREIERKITTTRKTLHGYHSNRIIEKAKIIKSEKLSYKAFQKLYGRSVARSAPAMFVNLVKEKLKRRNGTFIDIPTRTTKLSQTCHCGNVKKKKLSERWHTCECGMKAQRDLYSAFLAKCVTKSKKLSFPQAKKQWKNIQVLLDDCMNDLKKKRKEGKSIPSSMGV
ncbi:transposase [Bacillus multifaciens]|uniref:transposase n=1 Tax=Bacillus multifaciens TaxID=3068506 RepID=UPI002740DCAA|nr:transposase [Bacillus sp. WLY-B-L8]MDP7979991.1 transposase [Bacillus sp. WLY-B-L8]HDX9590637.1 transposase [Bacillus pseudomycoides]